ncbi:MAG: sulfatase [Planctomycetota bacterium]|nr:sulfatase [Planctomycetota bacterium]
MTRPNLLFVFADQMRGMDMGCAGNPDMITPVMDRLAREGVMCRRAYATVPVCGPARACLLTGTYNTTNGVMFNDVPLAPGRPTLGTLAKANGYRAGYVGKWHLDGNPRDKFTPPGPRRLGFDDFWAVHNCIHRYDKAFYYRDQPTMIREDRYQPEAHTDLALEFIDRCAKEREPFCLVVSWEPPHNPYEEVPAQYQAMYDASKLRLRPNVKPIPKEVLDPLWSFPQTIADYCGLITSLDDQLGRLMAKLEETGQLDDTIVVFTSDHGDMMWSQGLLYKCVPYEESVNVPLLVRWPKGLPRGRTCDTLVGTVDLLPTLAGMLGWEIPSGAGAGGAGVEGLDLSTALRGEPGTTDPASAFLAFYTPYVFREDMPTPEWRGLRTARHTYAATVDRRAWMLFDNVADPYQMRNLANDPAAASVRRSLAAELERWLTRLGDPFLPAGEMEAAVRARRPTA